MNDSDEFLTRVCDKINDLRTSKGLSYCELGFRCDLDKSAIIKICKGERNIGIKTLHRIAKGLEVDPKDLLT